MQACPTSIDIPLFIRQISTGNPLGSAKTIFDQNILGGMCARVCPTETLCEEVCVREIAEGKPVQIGRLQRYATDMAMADGKQFYARAAPTGKNIAVVGAGPAGLAAAHRLAMYGHDVTIFEARPKAGGLNEYGIAAYKSVDGFAQAEVDYVTADRRHRDRATARRSAATITSPISPRYDAVFLGMGLAGVNALRAEGEDAAGVDNAVDFIAELRQASDLGALPVGRRVVVIGGGMTAIDAAVQSKLLGAEEVTICYRRGQEHMNASEFEQDLAAANGVIIRHWLQPEARDCRGRQGHRHRARIHRAPRRQARRHRRDDPPRRRPGVQGDRPVIRRGRAQRRSEPRAPRCKAAASAVNAEGRTSMTEGLGRRRLRCRRARGPDGLLDRGGPRRGGEHPPGVDGDGQLEQGDEFVDRQAGLVNDGSQHSGREIPAAMDRHRHTFRVPRTTHEVVAAFYPDHDKACFLQRFARITPRYDREARHRVTRRRSSAFQ